MQRPIPEEHTRTVALLSEEGVDRLAAARVAVFGIGGVGGHLAEALARAGVGHIILVDKDTVSLSNINRQAVALHSTVGRPKVEVMAERIRDINPACFVEAHEMFYLPETADRFDLSGFDFVADCVDTVAAKVDLAVRCDVAGTPIIAAMGAGNKLHPERFRISDISKTETEKKGFLASVYAYFFGDGEQKGIFSIIYSGFLKAMKSFLII